MNALISMASLALAGTAVAAHPGLKAIRQTTNSGSSSSSSSVTAASNMTLTPISLVSAPANFTPRTDVTLPYGLNNTDFVNVTLTMPSSIILETIESLAHVDCEADSVILTFDNTEDLNAAYTAWSAFKDLVLITNHLGDCDTEFERGFFLASIFTLSNSTLVAAGTKTDVSSTASYMRAKFAGLPGQTSSLAPATSKRDIVADPGAISVSSVWDLPSLTLFEYDPYLTAKAKSGSLAVAVTLDGYLDIDIWGLNVDALYVDVTTTTSVDLELELSVSAAYSDTFSYTDGIEYYVVQIPGLLTFGPELSFAVGADVSVNAAVDVVVDLGADIENGTVHLDLVGGDTSAAGWQPTYYSNLTFSQDAAASVTPFVSVTVGLDFSILGGLLDLSSGLTPKVQFPVNATLSATQAIDAATGANVTVTQPDAAGACANGLEVESDFEFTLDAFVTEFWSTELYSVTVPIADECYSWA